MSPESSAQVADVAEAIRVLVGNVDAGESAAGNGASDVDLDGVLR